MIAHQIKTDILIVGGGVGGCAAAMAASSMGVNVVLTETSHWLGGQLTSQAVPPDEHPWIEKYGRTARYQHYRQSIRAYYRTHYPLKASAVSDPYFDPGRATVSAICHEPRVALAVIDQMLAFSRTSGRLRVLLSHEPVATDIQGDCVRSVTLLDQEKGHHVIVEAAYILDATEWGELLPLAGVEYVSGAESQHDTGELHAVNGPAQPDNVQAMTWCFPLAFDPSPEANHVIEKPAQYEYWKQYSPHIAPPWTGSLLSWDAPHPITLAPRRFELFGDLAKGDFSSLWHYRRIICTDHYDVDQRPHEVTLVNWPQNDYFIANVIDQPPDIVERCFEEARQLSLSLVYWLQTAAPHPDGKEGYPGLYMCPELTGRADGLALKPYVREARRIQAKRRVTENDLGFDAREGQPAQTFTDSVGTGYYRIDLHPTTGGNNYIDIATMPFQIPLGALLPKRVKNVIAAGKCMGMTHIANGCLRLHPVEWNIGESAGLLAAFCLSQNTCPHAVHADKTQLSSYQTLLIAQGISLVWPDSVIQEHQQKMRIQNDI